MSISVEENKYPPSAPTLDIYINGETSIASFKELVQRATNLWPDASKEIKEFADIITNGKVTQDYQDRPKSTIKFPSADQYELDTDKTSIRYSCCRNCVKHINPHTAVNGTFLCPDKLERHTNHE